MKPKVLILEGFGINCERETEYGFFLAGAKPERVHLTQLIKKQKRLKDYQILVFPGGFSFGDDISAGKILALKIKNNLKEEILEFIKKGKLIIGICNGFQVLVKMGILPYSKDFSQKVTLTLNDSGKFIDEWVSLRVNKNSPCFWTKNIERLYLPIRHSQGKFVFKDEKVKREILKKNQIVLQYEGKNPNGSQLKVAGICDETGRIFGLMPHPEAFLIYQNHPKWQFREKKDFLGWYIFKNGVKFVKKEL